MRLEFLALFNLYFQKVGDCCPKYEWDKYIETTFKPYELTKAIEYTQEIIEKEYICVCDKDIGECYEITLLGFENLLER